MAEVQKSCWKFFLWTMGIDYALGIYLREVMSISNDQFVRIPAAVMPAPALIRYLLLYKSKTSILVGIGFLCFCIFLSFVIVRRGRDLEIFYRYFHFISIISLSIKLINFSTYFSVFYDIFTHKFCNSCDIKIQSLYISIYFN